MVLRISSVHFVRCLPLLLLPPVNPNINSFPSESDVRIMCPKYSRVFHNFCQFCHCFFAQGYSALDLMDVAVIGDESP
jgi:hypothetical protein